MHYDLHELCRSAGEGVAVPAFPVGSIRARIARASTAEPKRRPFSALFAVALALVAVAAAAAILTQSHIRFTRSGGMVIESQHAVNRAISSEADIMRAAAQMNFHVTLPAGLPAGSRPIRLYVGDSDVMAITYDLPGAWRASHHLAWIFLANPNVMSTHVPETQYKLRVDRRMSSTHWRVGGEQVIVVSNGLTPDEVAKIESTMGGR